MIASLHGKLIASDAQSVIVECGGVGFKCFTSLKTIASMPSLGNDVFLHTYLSVREDALDLYGFATEDELNCFKLITSVNGVGSKIGIAVLSEFEPKQVLLFIAGEDSRSLSKASGVGPKLANRIILELKDKVGGAGSFSDSNIDGAVVANNNVNSRDAIEALVSLGYTKSAASLAVGKFDPTMSVESLITNALQILSK